MGFVDLHAHILPGLDDGPRTMEQTLAMARAAAADGTDIILATPHQRDVMLQSTIGEVPVLIDAINEALEEETSPGTQPLRVLPGMENHIELELPEWVERGLALPINGTRFILCEPPYTEYPPYADQVLFRLQLMRMVPIIAHPERNEDLRKSQSRLKEMIDRDMLMQVSAGSFIGEYGIEVQRAAESMLRSGLIHIVSSDMHGVAPPRSPVLSESFNRVAELAGEQTAFQLFDETPRRVIQGQDPRVIPPVQSSRPRWPLRRLFGRG